MMYFENVLVNLEPNTNVLVLLNDFYRTEDFNFQKTCGNHTTRTWLNTLYGEKLILTFKVKSFKAVDDNNYEVVLDAKEDSTSENLRYTSNEEAIRMMFSKWN